MTPDNRFVRARRRRGRIARRARRIIETEYARPTGCTTAAIARRLGVSRARLCNCYREAYEHTIGQDIRAHRIAAAVRLLEEDPQRLVKEVAAEVGFGRRAYRTFFNCFREETGQSPREFRRQLRRAGRRGRENQSRISSA